jgi:hypothetical protein
MDKVLPKYVLGNQSKIRNMGAYKNCVRFIVCNFMYLPLVHDKNG